MVDLVTYVFKYLNAVKITPEGQFTNAYVGEVYESENIRSSEKVLPVILYDKYEKADLHKVIETQCQHLTMTQRNEMLKLLQIFEYLFDGTLGTCKTDILLFELKEDTKTIFLQPYPVTKVHEKKFQKLG